MKVVVVVPSSLIGNFRDELRLQCADEEYIVILKDVTKSLNPEINFIENNEDSNKKIDKNYKIYSYHKFIKLCNEKKIKLKIHY